MRWASICVSCGKYPRKQPKTDLFWPGSERFSHGCFWAMVRQNMMAEGAGRIEMLTSWQPGNGEREKRKGPGIGQHSRVHSSDPALPNRSHFLSFYYPQISTIDWRADLLHTSPRSVSIPTTSVSHIQELERCTPEKLINTSLRILLRR